jgi:hypothetical protein
VGLAGSPQPTDLGAGRHKAIKRLGIDHDGGCVQHTIATRLRMLHQGEADVFGTEVNCQGGFHDAANLK